MKIFCTVFVTALLVQFGQIFADTGGIISVISMRQTIDGRPLLWQNFDSDDPFVHAHFFNGKNYDFIALVNGTDTTTVYSGLNTAAFGIISNSMDNDSSGFIKNALATCSDIDDFDILWQNSDWRGKNISIACIDAYGGAVLYDVNRRHAVNDPTRSPDGFLVRSNFGFYKEQQPDSNFWRYHRSRKLIKKQGRSISVKNIVQKISRDFQTLADAPYPPSEGESTQAVATLKDTQHCINQHNTSAAVFIHGVRPQENPDFATIWMTLGEPACGVATPMWPVTGETPFECTGEKNILNSIIRANERDIYNNKKFKTFFDINLYTDKKRGLLSVLTKIENEIFNDTAKALAAWRAQRDYLEDMVEFQNKTATRISRSIKY